MEAIRKQASKLREQVARQQQVPSLFLSLSLNKTLFRLPDLSPINANASLPIDQRKYAPLKFD